MLKYLFKNIYYKFYYRSIKKIEKEFSNRRKKNKNSIFKFNMFIENILIIKKNNNFKSNFDLDPDLKSENKNYSRYGKIKIAKPNKFYKKREKLEF